MVASTSSVTLVLAETVTEIHYFKLRSLQIPKLAVAKVYIPSTLAFADKGTISPLFTCCRHSSQQPDHRGKPAFALSPF